MKHACTCKVCNKPIVVEIAEDYMGIVEKLLPFAACDRCFDRWLRRKRCEAGIERICIQIATRGDRATPDEKQQWSNALTSLTKLYTQWAGDLHNIVPVWTCDFVQQLMDYPNKWHTILDAYRRGIAITAREAHAQNL